MTIHPAVRPQRHPARQRTTNRSPPARAGSPRRGTGPPPPGPASRSGSRSVGQAGVGEEELAPLVHEVEARGERRLVLVARGGRARCRRAGRRPRQPLGVRRRRATARSHAPGGRPARRSPRPRCAANRRPARAPPARTSRGHGLTQTPGRVARRSPRNAELGAQPGRGRCGPGARRRTRAASGRPTPACPVGRSGPPRRPVGARPRRWRGSPRPTCSVTGVSQPWGTIREIAVRTAGAAMPTGASSRTRAATGAWLPRERRWSPYTSNSADRACMAPSLPARSGQARRRGGPCRTDRGPIGDNGPAQQRQPRHATRTGRGARMAAMKPRTGDGPLEVTKEGRGIVMRVPLEGGGRLVVELNAEEAGALGDASRTSSADPMARRRPGPSTPTLPPQVSPPEFALSGALPACPARGRRASRCRCCRPTRPRRPEAGVLLGPGAAELADALGDRPPRRARDRAGDRQGRRGHQHPGARRHPRQPRPHAWCCSSASALPARRDLRRAGAALARAVPRPQRRRHQHPERRRVRRRWSPSSSAPCSGSFGFHWRSDGPQHRPVAQRRAGRQPDRRGDRRRAAARGRGRRRRLARPGAGHGARQPQEPALAGRPGRGARATRPASR